MEFNSWHGEKCDVVNVGSSLVAETIAEVTPELDHLVQDCQDNILIDMSDLEELDSSGISVLVYLFRRLKLEKREMAVLGLHGKPDELIHMMRIDKTIPQFKSYDDYLTRH
ncbi:anti-sigma factor antagonist [Endozoicomonas sp. OPT23]|uniref:STAS domain-containing protein n=1 Tax=Endozoicomonas sp. OPT23 TaxID=2072845 RepID=UPI00129B072B|nr:STAS domain-containing protein [Endozoicomonas sp. OPT23]MRI32190.1 anti-sigma factor antagonist [Endozoicomonas sp. OPT23]